MKPLKLPDNAEVTPDFVDLMIEIYTTWLEKIQLHMSPNTIERYGPFIQRLLPIVRRQSPNLHSGLDYEITRLRGNQYMQKFTTHERGDRCYLVGITRDITLRNYIAEKLVGHMGSYRIFLSPRVFTMNDMRLVHMIPEANPNSIYRHPHHYVSGTDRVSDRLKYGVHPLDAETGNCWGTFSAPVKGAIDNPDIPVLFSLLGKHLSTQGNGPPVPMEQIDFSWRRP